MLQPPSKIDPGFSTNQEHLTVRMQAGYSEPRSSVEANPAQQKKRVEGVPRYVAVRSQASGFPGFSTNREPQG